MRKRSLTTRASSRLPARSTSARLAGAATPGSRGAGSCPGREGSRAETSDTSERPDTSIGGGAVSGLGMPLASSTWASSATRPAPSCESGAPSLAAAGRLDARGVSRTEQRCQPRQVGGEKEPVQPREGMQRLVDERVALAAHLRRHGAERFPEVVRDEERAGGLRAIVAHGRASGS